MSSTIRPSELSSARMAGGNEKLYDLIVDGDVVKQWVGIGWVDVREADDEDRALYPTVDRSEA